MNWQALTTVIRNLMKGCWRRTVKTHQMEKKMMQIIFKTALHRRMRQNEDDISICVVSV